MAATPEADRYGLRLTLGGAPSTPHFVDGVVGLYWPDEPTPLADRVTLEDARRLHDTPGCPLELVEVKKQDRDRLEARHQDAIREAMAGIGVTRRTLGAEGDETHILNDQIAAVKAAAPSSDPPAAGEED